MRRKPGGRRKCCRDALPPSIAEAQGGSRAPAVARRSRKGAAHLTLAPNFPRLTGKLYCLEMASDTMTDCFFHRGMPKIRRSPVTSAFCILVLGVKSLGLSF